MAKRRFFGGMRVTILFGGHYEPSRGQRCFVVRNKYGTMYYAEESAITKTR